MVKHCHDCQVHGNLNNFPHTELHGLSEPWPFSAWGNDIIGEIRPNASNGHRFIVVAVDHISKWVETESFRNVTAKQMANFIAQNHICRYGMPHHMVTDNEVQFQAETKAMLQNYGIGHHKSSPYRPQANGAVEVDNKTIKNILAKMTQNYRDWADKLPYALNISENNDSGHNLLFGLRNGSSTASGSSDIIYESIIIDIVT